ncbi:DUF775-domain-containing protein [Thelephora ganbajun]|uniref:DUF775-domain-containing protein n=1 Tax=Thelephora ganbajun TaxID=370292 RepID=A0ACB6ZBP3_THEGA|nr:DUF775-domain-containing protein [Thelephora ganbajun]
MFGCVVAGRPLQTNLQQVDETHALFELPNASTINHICVFLLGTVSFPEGYGATVHFHWPEKGFQLLGMLSNDKPSAIFRLRGTFTPGASAGPTAFAGGVNLAAGGDVTAILGIAIEPLSQIAPALPDPGSANANGAVVVTTRTADPGYLAEQIVKHLLNFISSFVGDGTVNENTLVPMSAVVRWYEGFKTKLKNMGPGFLDRATD